MLNIPTHESEFFYQEIEIESHWYVFKVSRNLKKVYEGHRFPNHEMAKLFRLKQVIPKKHNPEVTELNKRMSLL